MDKEPDLIERLGGTHELARELQQKYTTVLNWKTRGIPWRWRHQIASLAEVREVPLPDDFLRPQVA